MSGVPKLGTWATEANFPAGAGAWNGQPCKVVPTGDLHLPNVKPPAEWRNYLDNRLHAQDVGLQSLVVAHALNMWIVKTTATSLHSGASFVGSAWDPAGGRWYAALNQISNPVLLYAQDGGRTWVDSFLTGYSATPIPGAIASAGNDAIFPLLSPTTTTVAGLAYVSNVSGILLSMGVPANVATSLFSQAFLKYLIFAETQGSGVYSNGALVITDGATVSTFTSGVPAAFSSGTGNAGQLLSAQSPTTMMVALCGVTPGADTARLLAITNDGHGNPVFANVTPAGTFTHHIITGLAYDANDATWGLLTYDGSSSYFFYSTDGLAWIQQNSWSGPAFGGLACIGSVWAAAMKFAWSFDGNAIGAWRIYLSGDLGVTWHPTSGPTFAAAPNLASSGNQLVAWTPAELSVSGQVGFV